jgi:hypothetical protein
MNFKNFITSCVVFTGHHQVLILRSKLLHFCICFFLFLACWKYSSLMCVTCFLSFFGAACVLLLC